jgi:dTDP-4-dehydrorhamnose reductase
MKILVTGSTGMLAHDLVSVLKESHEVAACSEHDLDITLKDNVRGTIANASPHLVINCAAYTQVDKAEEEREKAFLINGIGVQNLALACSERGIPLCHISTDYVFDGEKESPYTPFDNTNPINTYGESKLAGEKYIQWIMNAFYIVRTSWLYGKAGNNFVSTILRLAKDNPEIRVVHDQRGSPTSTVTLSHGIRDLIRSGAYGIYHYTDETGGGISWYEFAGEIIRTSGFATKVIPITTEDFPRPAKRPRASVLDTSLFRMVSGHHPKNWKDALRDYLRG